MNIKHILSVVVGTTAVAVAACSSVTAAPDTPPAAEGTPSEIKDSTPLAEQIDAYNAQRKTSSAERGAAGVNSQNPGVDPQAKNLANKINAYNGKSEPDENAAAIETPGSAGVDRPRSAAEREATERLGSDVRRYNKTGGASAFSDDGDN